jgi:hypothetical protein
VSAVSAKRKTWVLRPLQPAVLHLFDHALMHLNVFTTFREAPKVCKRNIGCRVHSS